MGTAAQAKPVGALPERPTQSDRSARRRAVAHTARVRRNLLGPLLIASEEGIPLGGALRLAEALGRRDGVGAHVLTMVRPLSSLSSYLLSFAADLERHELEACRGQSAHTRARRQLYETVEHASSFSTGVEFGDPVSTTASTARLRTVEYTLLGLPSVGAPARARTEDTVFRLAEAAGVPVLAVPAEVDRLPRSALVHMDFGEASMRAARATIPLLASGGSLTLAHVVPEMEFAPPHAEGWMEVSAKGVADVLHRLGDDLRLAGNLEVRTVVLQGDPAELLTELARDFDLTAVGAPKRRSFGRFLMASVSADVLRAAEGTVLVAPAPQSGQLSS